MRRRRSLAFAFAFAFAIAVGCGGQLVEENVASTADGPNGTPAVFVPEPDYPPPPYDPPLIAIQVDRPFGEDAGPEDSGLAADASGDAGCCAVSGSLVHPEAGCHEQARVVLACVLLTPTVPTCAETATPSCAERSGADGGVERFVLWSTWSSLAGTGLELCSDAGGGAIINVACP